MASSSKSFDGLTKERIGGSASAELAWRESSRRSRLRSGRLCLLRENQIGSGQPIAALNQGWELGWVDRLRVPGPAAARHPHPDAVYSLSSSPQRQCACTTASRAASTSGIEATRSPGPPAGELTGVSLGRSP